jgi:ketosteroid isomerase-like protein
MSNCTLAAALALAIAGLAPHAAVAAGDDVARLIEIDKRMQRAFVDRDIEALREIFTDDYILVVSSGEERNKAEVIAEVASPDVRWEVNATSDWVVRVHGDTAILVANLHQKGVRHGKPFDSNVKFSDTYIRVGGTWRNVHAHASLAVDVEPRVSAAETTTPTGY